MEGRDKNKKQFTFVTSNVIFAKCLITRSPAWNAENAWTMTDLTFHRNTLLLCVGYDIHLFHSMRHCDGIVGICALYSCCWYGLKCGKLMTAFNKHSLMVQMSFTSCAVIHRREHCIISEFFRWRRRFEWHFPYPCPPHDNKSHLIFFSTEVSLLSVALRRHSL